MRTLLPMPEPETEAGYQAFLDAVGGRIRRERLRAGLTLEELAERSGFTLRMVQYCEDGRRAPSLHALWRLSRALDVPARNFLPETPGS